MLKELLNRLFLHPLGLDLARRRDDGEFASRMVSADQIEAQQREIAAVAGDFLRRRADFLPDPGDSVLGAIAGDFFELYARRPVLDNSGGSGFNDSFWIYLMGRLLQPALIVESGTHKGHSAWLLRQACPRAEIHCFDVNPANLVHRESDIRYHGHDWTAADLGAVDGESALCFFDDHINQAQRLREAHDRGFRTLILDDDCAAHALYATGHPPVPTVRMLIDGPLAPGQRLEWLRHGRAKSYTFAEEDTHGARELIERWAATPDLAPVTRYRPQSGLTVVRLKPGAGR